MKEPECNISYEDLDYKGKLFDNGLPFTDPLGRDLSDQVVRVRDGKKATLITIDGGLGEGKTTMGVHAADYIMKCWNGDEELWVDLKEQYSMGGEQFQEKLKICYEKKHVVVLYDEAGDFNTRGALTQFNRQLNRVFETFRAFKIIVIVVLPAVDDIDNSLLKKKLVRLHINCYGRNNRYGNLRIYSGNRLHYLRAAIRRETVPSKAYSKVRPNYFGHFYDLEPGRSKELEEISMKGKMSIVNENILESKGLVSYKDISKKLNRSVSWVRQKISEKDIKAQTVYKRKKYFDKLVIGELEVEKT